MLSLVFCTLLAVTSALAGIERIRTVEGQNAQVAARMRAALHEQAARFEAIQVENVREISPLATLAQGLEGALPARFSSTKEGLRFGESRSAGSIADTLYGTLDMTFVVGAFFSLIALLLTFDSVCGERNSGTLAVLLSYPVSRFQVLAAKVVAPLVVLTAGLVLAELVVVSLMATARITPVSVGPWLAFGLLSWAYLVVWAGLGVAVSARARTPSAAALVCVLIWTCVVFLLPRLISGTSESIWPAARLDQPFLQEDREDSRLRSEFNQRMNKAFEALVLGGSGSQQEADFNRTRRAAISELEHSRELLSRRTWEAIQGEERGRARWIKALSLVSPMALFQNGAAELACTGFRQRLEFFYAARRYHETIGRRLADSREIYFARDAAGRGQGRTMDTVPESLFVPFHTTWATGRRMFAEVLGDAAVLVSYGLLILAAGRRAVANLDVRG